MLYVWVPAAQARLRQASPVASPPSADLEMTSSLQGALLIKMIFLIFLDESFLLHPKRTHTKRHKNQSTRC